MRHSFDRELVRNRPSGSVVVMSHLAAKLSVFTSTYWLTTPAFCAAAGAAKGVRVAIADWSAREADQDRGEGRQPRRYITLKMAEVAWVEKWGP